MKRSATSWTVSDSPLSASRLVSRGSIPPEISSSLRRASLRALASDRTAAEPILKLICRPLTRVNKSRTFPRRKGDQAKPRDRPVRLAVALGLGLRGLDAALCEDLLRSHFQGLVIGFEEHVTDIHRVGWTRRTVRDNKRDNRIRWPGMPSVSETMPDKMI